jgi:hypothetical protein
MLALLLVPSIAFAQSAQITLLTDKQSYVTDDTISISGTIPSLGASNSAVLQVYNPFKVLAQIGTIPIASDGTFHYTLKAEGQSWQTSGSYQIKVIYISTPVLATSTVNVDFKAQSTPQPQTQPSPQPEQQQYQQPPTPSVGTNTTVVTADTQTPVEEQIKQRIALANKLKGQLDSSTPSEIPFWVKDTARKWHDGAIDNAGYSKDIQYLVSSGLVKANVQPTYSFEHIPSWLKDVSNWWSQGIISDYDYVNSIQFLLDEKIIK